MTVLMKVFRTTTGAVHSYLSKMAAAFSKSSKARSLSAATAAAFARSAALSVDEGPLIEGMAAACGAGDSARSSLLLVSVLLPGEVLPVRSR